MPKGRPKRCAGLIVRRQDDPLCGMSRIARERTRPHLDHMNWVEFDLVQFAVNCYMQEAEDMATAVAMNPQRALGTLLEPVSEQEPILEFEI